MRFDTDRCVHCGHLLTLPFKPLGNAQSSQLTLNHSGRIEASDPFAFCSDECFAKALHLEPYGDGLPYNLYISKLNELADKYPGPTDQILSDTAFNEMNKFKTQFRQDHFRSHAKQYRQRWYAEVSHAKNQEQQKLTAKEQEVSRKRREQQEQERLEHERFQEIIKPRPIPQERRAEHTFILGPAGAGKTTLLENIILEDLKRPDPPAMVIVDPKGLMIQRISKLALFDPIHGRLRDRLIIIDPASDPPPALNLFDPACQWNRMWSDRVRQQIETQIIGLFGYIFSAGGFKLTAKQQVDFSYVVRLLFSVQDSTIHTLLDVLDDPAKKLDDFSFRSHVQRLDSISQRFFKNEFFTEFKESKAQIKARLYMILQHPSIAACLSAPKRKIDLIDALQKKKIILVNTAMTTLGPEASTLIGRYFIASTLNAAFVRTSFSGIRDFATLVVDEFQEFADETKTPQMLKLAREYNLGIVMATQNFHSPPFNDSLRNDISTNTSIKYASSPEGVDLAYMARDLRCEPQFLRTQTRSSNEARFACYVRGLTEHPMALAFPFGAISDEPQMDQAAHQLLLDQNIRRVTASPEERTLAHRDDAPSPAVPPSNADIPPADSVEPVDETAKW